MTIRTAALILVLLLGLAFEGGVLFDRWLHRPITAGGITVEFPTGSLHPAVGTPPPRCFTDGSIPCAPQPKPTPDCNNDLQKCEPNDDAGDYEVPELRAYGDCARGKNVACAIREHECWWWPFGDNYCQKET